MPKKISFIIDDDGLAQLLVDDAVEADNTIMFTIDKTGSEIEVPVRELTIEDA